MFNRRRGVVSLLAVLSLAGCSSSERNDRAAGSTAVRPVSEALLRDMIAHSRMPAYVPAADQPGVAVVRVLVSTEGVVTNVQPLEGTAEQAAAVVAAVSQWRFKPETLVGRPARGVLTFYFEAAGGGNRVWNPADAPYVGRWRARGASVPNPGTRGGAS